MRLSPLITQSVYNGGYRKEEKMRNTYIQVEILLCLLDCQRHTLLEIQNKIGYGKETIRRHVQDLSILLPIEIYRSGRKGQQGGGGIRLQKNFLLKILFEKSEIEIILQSLDFNIQNVTAQKLKEKIERMLGSK